VVIGPPRRSARGLCAALTLIALITAACSSATPIDEAVSDVAAAESPTDRADPADPGEPADPGNGPAPGDGDPAPRPAPAPDPTAPVECDPVTRDAVATTVSAQLQAFADEDFAAAYGWTSPTFRRAFSAEEFETLIRSDYSGLVANAGHRFAECGIRERRAFIVVGVRTDGGESVLRYDLSDEPDGWRIDGAGLLPAISLPPERLV